MKDVVMILLSRMLLVLFLCLLCVGEAFAEIKRVAVLEFRGVGVDQAVLLKLSDQARSAGLSVLSKEEYLMMTRENMREILSDMGKNADCMEGKCEVETGRNIGADIIVTGDILQMGKIYVLTLKLYETDRGVLLSTQEVEDPDLFNLKNKTHDQSIVLFQEGGLNIPQSNVSTVSSGFGGAFLEEEWQASGGNKVVYGFSSQPKGAAVLLDGQMLCAGTPCSKEISKGTHQVEFQMERYLPYKSSITANANGNLQGTLSPKFGYLSVSSKVVGATVFLDAKPIGKTPFSKMEVDSGVHRLSIEDPCYVGDVYQFQLESGKTETVAEYPIVAKKSGVSVSVSDASGNALVGTAYVDGLNIGQTPVTATVALCSKELVVDVGGMRHTEKLSLVEKQVKEIRIQSGGNGIQNGGRGIGNHVWNGNGYKALLIPAGSFTMGCTSEQGSDCDRDEKPSHKVEISKAFYLMESEVTQELYENVIGSNPSFFKGPKRPVEKVSWYDAVTFANKLSALEGREQCYQISVTNVSWTNKDCTGWRLPTEAEWEYAARGGESYKYAGSNTVGDVAWYNGNSGSSTHDVCGKPKNGYGLCDMSGNVWEWIWNWRGSYSSGTHVDSTGPTSGSSRVLRGGSWDNDSRYERDSNRSGLTPSRHNYGIGFRLARTP